jgi:AAA domain-containing protein
MKTTDNTINQGVAAVVAEPKTLYEAKAEALSWFRKHTNREHRLRKAYAFELVNRKPVDNPDMVPATVEWTDHEISDVWQAPLAASHSKFEKGEPSEAVAESAVDFYETKRLEEGLIEYSNKVPWKLTTKLDKWDQDDLLRYAETWIDAGETISKCASRVLAKSTGTCYRATEQECEHITFEAWLTRDKRAEERAKRQRQEEERQEKEKRKAAEKAAKEHAAREAEEQAQRDKIARENREKLDRKKRGEPTFADEAYEPLPGDLRLVALRLGVESEDDDDDTAVRAIERVFGILGCVDLECDGGYSVGVELVTKATLAERYLQSDSQLVKGWTLDGACFELVDDLIEVSKEFKRRSGWTFRGISALSDTPYKSGDFQHWVEGVTVQEEDFEKIALLIDVCCGDVKAVSRVLQEKSTEPTPQTWLVPGVIPHGTVTLLLGDKKHGKTAMAQQLAVAYTQREKEWLGFPLDASRGGFAVYLLGQDSPGESSKRVTMMTGGELPFLLQVRPADGTEIDDLLAQFASQKIGLLVVDPCRKYTKATRIARTRSPSCSPSSKPSPGRRTARLLSFTT